MFSNKISIVELSIIFGVVMIFFITLAVVIHHYNNKLMFESYMKAYLQEKNTLLQIDDRLEYTENLLKFIDELISIELINNKRFEIFLSQNDKNLNADNCLEEIALEVFHALKPEIFTNENNILSDEYLMKYINKKTFLAYFSYIQDTINNQM